jgi:hypothetical protein
VKERLVRDAIIFNFHKEGQPVREYIERVFKTASFLGYEASEQQLVDRTVMNIHPDMLIHAAFIDRPRTRKELNDVVRLIEERGSVSKERERQLGGSQVSHVREVGSRGRLNNTPKREGFTKATKPVCWGCGQSGHVSRNCPRTPKESERQVDAQRSEELQAKILDGVRKVQEMSRETPFWTIVRFSVGEGPALIDTVAQFSRVHKDVIEYLYKKGNLAM